MQINPSILSADFANLEAELAEIATADMAHIDVMDNHFVPNLTIGQQVVARLAQVSPIPLDVHLMITDPERWAPSYAEVGASSVTFHLEASREPIELAKTIRSIGSKAAIAIKPATAVSELTELMEHFDMVLIMTVEPGFGGQPLIADTMEKVRQARSLIRQASASVTLQVDGGVTEANIAQLAELGANSFVAGSAIFNRPDRALEILKLRSLAEAAGHKR